MNFERTPLGLPKMHFGPDESDDGEEALADATMNSERQPLGLPTLNFFVSKKPSKLQHAGRLPFKADDSAGEGDRLPLGIPKWDFSKTVDERDELGVLV